MLRFKMLIKSQKNKKFNQFYETFRACKKGKDLEKKERESFLLVATAKFILQIIRKKIRASNFKQNR